MTPFLDMVNEVPRGEKEHKGDEKYKSKCLRLNNNHITELTDMWAIVDQIIAQPDAISWIDLSFNELTKINPVSKAFSLADCFCNAVPVTATFTGLLIGPHCATGHNWWPIMGPSSITFYLLSVYILTFYSIASLSSGNPCRPNWNVILGCGLFRRVNQCMPCALWYQSPCFLVTWRILNQTRIVNITYVCKCTNVYIRKYVSIHLI